MGLLKASIIFILLMYFGKSMYWMYCTGECDEDRKPEGVEDCQCYTEVKRDGYWEDFNHSILEALGGLVLSAILYGCCCVRN